MGSLNPAGPVTTPGAMSGAMPGPLSMPPPNPAGAPGAGNAAAAGAQLLHELAPAHAPPPPGFWPPAPGWWLLLVLLLTAAGLLLRWWRDPHRRLRVAALAELKQLEQGSAADPAFASALQNLLRRYALARHGAAVAPLSGERWLAFLGEHGAPALAGEAGEALLRASWGVNAALDRASLLTGARAFLRARR